MAGAGVRGHQQAGLATMDLRGLRKLLLAGCGLALVAAAPGLAPHVALGQPQIAQAETGAVSPSEPQAEAVTGTGEQAEQQPDHEDIQQIEQFLVEAEQAVQQDDFRTAHDALDEASASAQEAMLQDEGGFPREQLQELELAIAEAQQAVRGDDRQAAEEAFQDARRLIEAAREALPEGIGAAEQPMSVEPEPAAGQQAPARQP